MRRQGGRQADVARLPDAPGDLVAAQVERLEVDARYLQLLRPSRGDPVGRQLLARAQSAAPDQARRPTQARCNGPSALRVRRTAPLEGSVAHLRGGVLRGLVLVHALVLQHVHERGLASVVETLRATVALRLGLHAAWSSGPARVDRRVPRAPKTLLVAITALRAQLQGR